MRNTPPSIVLILTFCLVFAGCDGTSIARKNSVWDLYDMHRQAAVKAGLPVDNDAYYRAPGSYSGINCNTINDLPSCSGD